jgi:hypothetical protein
VKSSVGSQTAGGKKASSLDPSSQLGGAHPGDKQRLNEQRKLEHRQNIADHLRSISDKNGNENLKTVADRLDQKAQEHYDKRIAKLDSRDGVLNDPDGALAGAEDVLDGAEDILPTDAAGTVVDGVEDALAGAGEVLDAPAENQLADAAQKLTGRENALYRQLRNEERKLNQRMAAVERLNQLYEQTGDSQYLDAAERLETMALDHYEARLAKITEFQQRFNLPWPESAPIPAPAP